MKGLNWVWKLEKLLFFMKNDWKFIFSIFHTSVKFSWVTRIQKYFFAIWHYQQRILSKMNHIWCELKHFLSKIRWETYRSNFGHFAWFAQNTAQMRYRVKIFHILTNFRIQIASILASTVKHNGNTQCTSILNGWVPPPLLKKRNWLSTHFRVENYLNFRSFFTQIKPDYQEKHEKIDWDHLLWC